MSVGIHFEHIVKKYGENVIIPDLNLDVREGEFFTLLGPSGCGKTTLLRMVAGFNSIEGGTIAFNGRVINDIAPEQAQHRHGFPELRRLSAHDRARERRLRP